jgi:uncharacterized protein (TIGR03067 family)
LQSLHENLTTYAAIGLTVEGMKLFRHIITAVCVVASFVANAGDQLTANAKGAANQPTNADLQLLQGTWEGVDLGDQESSKKPASQETSRRKPGEIDLEFLKTGVLESPPPSESPSPSHGKITITITGNSFHFHRDTNFWFETTIALPAGTNPKQLQATIKDCPTASSIGQVVFAIFKIEDGKLTLATEGAQGTRKSFEVSENPGMSRYELRKVQPQKKNAEPSKTK